MEAINVFCPICGAFLGKAYSGSRIEMKCYKCSCVVQYAVADKTVQYTIIKSSPKRKVVCEATNMRV